MDDEMVCSLQRCRVNIRKDGDLLFTTNNRVLVDNLRDLPALMCFQRKAKKVIPTEEILIQANIDSFGDDIGKVTNRITAMYDVQAKYNKDSVEYQTLEYRIMSGQQLQQNAIDKAKGIVAKPMPKTWYDYNSNKNDITMSKEQVDLNMRILANKKPYFMIYIYPSLKREYKKFITITNANAIKRTMMSADEILSLSEEEDTDDTVRFKREYYAASPVGLNGCVINKICWRIEELFDGYIRKFKQSVDIDISIIKSCTDYTRSQYDAVSSEKNRYLKQMFEYMKEENLNKVVRDEVVQRRREMRAEFIESCDRIVPNSDQLCEIMIDMCYKKNSTRQLVWDVSADTIIKNLLAKNNNVIRYPVLDDKGDVSFRGKRFSFVERTVEQDIYEQ